MQLILLRCQLLQVLLLSMAAMVLRSLYPILNNDPLASKVRPSDRLPSVRRRSTGSFVDGLFSRVKESKIMLFKLMCRVILPLLRLHDSACDPFTTTAAPQKHV